MLLLRELQRDKNGDGFVLYFFAVKLKDSLLF
jgi:hypothetical protein